jgi:hypothetical protein
VSRLDRVGVGGSDDGQTSLFANLIPSGRQNRSEHVYFHPARVLFVSQGHGEADISTPHTPWQASLLLRILNHTTQQLSKTKRTPMREELITELEHYRSTLTAHWTIYSGTWSQGKEAAFKKRLFATGGIKDMLCHAYHRLSDGSQTGRNITISSRMTTNSPHWTVSSHVHRFTRRLVSIRSKHS